MIAESNADRSKCGDDDYEWFLESKKVSIKSSIFHDAVGDLERANSPTLKKKAQWSYRKAEISLVHDGWAFEFVRVKLMAIFINLLTT